ncbi:hypothetical protein C2E23DRAFT_115272 [Lenzites betulinus]|nr:hypothetical protein C2E23DRAFT_115272 [Lenzites betulinus]
MISSPARHIVMHGTSTQAGPSMPPRHNSHHDPNRVSAMQHPASSSHVHQPMSTSYSYQHLQPGTSDRPPVLVQGYQAGPQNPPPIQVLQSLSQIHQHVAQANAAKAQELRQRHEQHPPPQGFMPPPPPQQLSAHAHNHAPPDASRSSIQPRAAPPAQSYVPSQGHTQPSLPVQSAVHTSGRPAASSSQPQSSNPPSDSTSSAPPNHNDILAQAARVRAQHLLEPAHTLMMDGLARTHSRIATELVRMCETTTQRDVALNQLQKAYDTLRGDYMREKAERERLERECEVLRAQVNHADSDAQKINGHLPKMLLDLYETREERDRLAQELTALQAANSQLRDKATVVQDDELMPSDTVEEKKFVKTEPMMFPPPLSIVKTEQISSAAIADHDTELAQVLAAAHEERKRKQRAERDLANVNSVLEVCLSGSPPL